MIKNRTAQLIYYTIYCTLGIVGCVASVTDQPNVSNRDMPTGEVESKLILTAAGFLGRQMES